MPGPLRVVLNDGQACLRPDEAGPLATGAAAGIDNPASYRKTNQKPFHQGERARANCFPYSQRQRLENALDIEGPGSSALVEG